MGNVVDYAAGRNRYIGYLMTVPTRAFNGYNLKKMITKKHLLRGGKERVFHWREGRLIENSGK